MADTHRRNKTTALTVVAVVGGMVGLSFASVPLYQLFCQVTGFGGTTQVAKSPENKPVLERRITVTFDSNVASDLDWSFKPVQKDITVHVGKETLVFYEARNDSNEPITGTATFNVTPYKIGQYFAKVDCFCFQEQTLQPGQTVQMPVSFFVDPAIAQDRNAKDVQAIALSYTFFRSLKKTSQNNEQISNSVSQETKLTKRQGNS